MKTLFIFALIATAALAAVSLNYYAPAATAKRWAGGPAPDISNLSLAVPTALERQKLGQFYDSTSVTCAGVNDGWLGLSDDGYWILCIAGERWRTRAQPPPFERY